MIAYLAEKTYEGRLPDHGFPWHILVSSNGLCRERRQDIPHLPFRKRIKAAPLGEAEPK